MASVAVRRSWAISNCVLHLDAQAGACVDGGTTPCADGETVQQWNDISGAGHHATQATEGKRPTYRATELNGLPAIVFTGANDMATDSLLDATYNTAVTLFYIGEMTGTGQRWAVGESGGELALAEDGEWQRFDHGGLGSPTYVFRGAQTANGNIRCVGLSYDGTTLRTIINGHLIKTARTGDLGAAGALTIGNRPDLTARWVGVIGEVQLWNTGATDAQMLGTCRGMLARWGLAVPATRKIIVYTGDSQTSFTGTDGMWPQVIAASMGHANQSHTIVAQGGVSLAYINEVAAGWLDPVYDATAALNVNLIWAGTNDLAGGVAAATVYGRLETYCNARRAAGWDKVIVFTALPRSAEGDDAGHEALRAAFNALVRANYASIADGMVDVAADERIGGAGDELDTTYYNADRVHLNTTGQAVIAELAQPVLAALL